MSEPGSSGGSRSRAQGSRNDHEAPTPAPPPDIGYVRELDRDGAVDLLETLSEKWKLGAEHIEEPFDVQVSHFFETFGIGYDDNLLTALEKDRGSFGLRQVDAKIQESELEAIALYHRMHELDLLPEKGCVDPEKHENLKRLVKVMEMVFYAKRTVLSAYQAKLAVHQLHAEDGLLDLDQDLDARLGEWSLRFRYLDSELTPFQSLVLYLLDAAMEKRYRKQGDHLYCPVIHDGFDTHAWEQAVEIKEFVYSMLRKETCLDQWKNATQNMKNVSNAVEYLTNCHDHQLPALVKQRGVYSFRNGVYVAPEDRFLRFGETRIPQNVTACKYIDAEFAPYDDWRDIPTPALDTIPRSQEWPDEVVDWYYIFVGRMLYSLGEKDRWQVAPFYKGNASAGKCVAKDTLILAFDGRLKLVQDVEVGDLIMGDDSTPRRVLSLARGHEAMYDLVPKGKIGMPTLRVTGDHVLCLKWCNHGSSANWKYGRVVQRWDNDLKKQVGKKFTTANADKCNEFLDSINRDETFEMTVNEYMALPDHAKKYMSAYTTGITFPRRPDPEIDAWAVGVWLGDGNSNGPIITTKDQEIVDKLSEKLGSMMIIQQKHPMRYGIRGEEAKKNPFMKFLRDANLIKNKHIPDEYKLGSREIRMAVLAGLLDTDGYRNKNGGYEITQKNKRLADDIVFIARSLGFCATTRPVKKHCWWKGTKREGTYHRINICADNALAELPLALAYKRFVPKSDGEYKKLTRYRFDVVPAGEQDYYGFETDGNHRFVLGDFTVTHNSTTLLKVIKLFFDTADVGILSNNIEDKFGLSAFHDKYVVLGPEVRNDLAINQADYQQIVSGEDTQINIKHKKAFSKVWTAPLAFAGNEVPGWADSGGAIQRRTVVFEFPKTIVNADMDLDKKLAAELPMIIQKTNKAYLEMAHKHSSVNVWNILPPYFHATRDALAQTTSSIDGFLATTAVRFGPEEFCSFDDFKSSLKEYEISNSIKSKKMDKDTFVAPFEKRKLKIVRDQRVYKGVRKLKDWIVGVTLVEDYDNALG